MTLLPDEEERITPPATPMLEQVKDWLLAQPPPPHQGFHHRVFSIGLTALSLRWGSWLGLILDEQRPPYPEKRMDHWYSVSVQNTLFDCNLTHNFATAARLCFQ